MSVHNEVMVYVRIRPTTQFAQELMEVMPDKQTVNVRLRKNGRKGVLNNQMSSWSFRLNGIMHNVSQEAVYAQVTHSVVLGALEGYNGTVMCFGQTGAGKTFTMTGATESYKQRGIIPRAIQEVFHEISNRVDHTFSVRLSFLEIYNETLVDLLASVKGGQKKHCGTLAVVEEPEGGVSVKGLSLHPVHREEEALNLLFEGEMSKIIGENALNKNSSRSHCIFTLYIESRSRTLSNATYVTSKLNLVDLAGSERLSKTGSEGQVQKEALYINRSLSFLEQAILALADRRREHVPFRQSKLTHALKDSLGGNCNTVLVANIYGEEGQVDETLSTLRFAARMKCVCTEPALNKHIDPVLQVETLQKEIQLLKQELSFQNTLANRAAETYEDLSETQVALIRSEVHRYLAGTLDEITIASIRQIHTVFAQFKKAYHEQEKHLEKQKSPKLIAVGNTQSTRFPSTDKVVIEDSGRLVGSSSPEPSDCQVPRETAANTSRGQNRRLGRENHPQTPDASQRDTRGNHVTKSPSRSRAPGLEPVEEVGYENRLTVPASSQRQSVSPSKGKKIKESSRKNGQGSIGLSEDLTIMQSETETFNPPNVSKGKEYANGAPKRCDTPPSKMEAFEIYKSEKGHEIDQILKGNKSVLKERLERQHDLTGVINSIKRDIDRMTSELQLCKEQRQRQGQLMSAEGEPVLDEAEVTLLLRLREAKDQYRQNYKELLGTRAEVQYCRHLVDQCRMRLFTEFESWYNESFLLPDEVLSIFKDGPIGPGLVPVDKALALQGNGQESTKLRADSPSATSFYNAYKRTVLRKAPHFSVSRSNMGSDTNKLP